MKWYVMATKKKTLTYIFGNKNKKKNVQKKPVKV